MKTLYTAPQSEEIITLAAGALLSGSSTPTPQAPTYGTNIDDVTISGSGSISDGI